MARASCTLEPGACDELLKMHVPSLEDSAWKNDDYEVVVAKYMSFLCGCAAQTTRLNSSIVAVSCVRIFGVPGAVGHNFGEAMSHALAHCHIKMIKATPGKKLSASVYAVIGSFRNSKASRETY